MYEYKNNKYTNWYFAIIDKALFEKRKKSKSLYYEGHHILPKSLGGSNKKANMVLLTGKEHYIVHLLLIRMVQPHDIYKMVHAIVRFSVKAARKYETLRKTISNYSKGEMNPWYGKGPTKGSFKAGFDERRCGPKHTEEHKKRLSEKFKENNPGKIRWARTDAGLKQSQSLTGRVGIVHQETNIKKRVRPSDLEGYLCDGWRKLRKN